MNNKNDYHFEFDLDLVLDLDLNLNLDYIKAPLIISRTVCWDAEYPRSNNRPECSGILCSGSQVEYLQWFL